MSTSGRRPVNGAGAAGSGRSSGGKPAGSSKPATPSGRRPAPGASRPPAGARAGRPRPGEDEDRPAEPSGATQAMFYGSIVLGVAVVILLIIKGPAIFNPPKPPEKIVKDDSVVFTEVDKLQKQADKEFKAAIKLQGNDARNKAIRGALETLAAAQDKLQALSEEPRYKGKEEYDAVFEEVQNKISIEMKKYRDSIRLGD